MDKLQIIEVRGQRVLTSKQISEVYDVSDWQIKQNYANNKSRFVEGKHCIILQGDELRSFKSKVENFYPVGKTANKLYLWTEKGALLHAKSLNTDKAWQVYDYLVDFYFRVKEEPKYLPSPRKDITSPKKDITLSVKNPIPVFKALMQLAETKGICINSYDFGSKATSLIKGNSIGIRKGLSLEQIDCELAYMLSHRLVHCDDGDIVTNQQRVSYDKRAERVAQMMLDVLDIATV